MRVSHLAAVATLVALLGAMFVAMGSASAAALGPCGANPDITLGFGDTCTIEVTKLDEDADEVSIDNPSVDGSPVAVVSTTATEVANGVLTIMAGSVAGSATVTVTKPDTDTSDSETNKAGTARDETATDDVASYTVNVLGFGISKVEIVGDNDNVVSAGAPVTARVTLRSQSAQATVNLTVPTTGLSIAQTVGGAATTTQSLTHPNDAVAMYDFTVNTAGAPAGEYTLTFAADNNPSTPDKAGSSNEAEKADSTTLMLTIGEPGTGLSSATLSLGNSVEDLPYTDKDEAIAEDGTEDASTGHINVVIEAFDSRDGRANSSAINQIIVIAPGGKINTQHETTANTASTKVSDSSSATLSEMRDDNGMLTSDDVGQTTVVEIMKDDKKPGSVTVYAIVSGPGGAATTNEITLTFSGPPTSLTLGDATETLLSVNVDGDDADELPDEDMIKLLVSATDAGGNNATPPSSASVVITDPNGKRLGDERIKDTWPTAAAADGKRYLMLTGMGSTSAPLAAGEYTVKVTSGNLEVTAMFAVAGNPSTVDVSASATSSDMIGDVITVTAAVTDEDGNKVSDGTSVQFDVSSNTGLAAIGTGHMGKDTKDGMASVKYAVVGAGHSVVSATAGGATGVIVIDSTAGMVEEEAMPEEEASVSCLSELSGFATWSCGVEADASAIFDMVTGRGVSAIHLWNGSTWVRYSVVDDAMVPGSSDFMVTENDILYISN